jgi:abhydrolase domain-containing protein 2
LGFGFGLSNNPHPADLYHAIEPHPEHGDFTLAICPGIGNNSESVYIRRVVYNAQLNGYRVCVLNHIGTLSSVPVTSPRLFMYGNTCDYAAMIKDLVRRFPTTKIVSVGFSMGGNLITKVTDSDWRAVSLCTAEKLDKTIHCSISGSHA